MEFWTDPLWSNSQSQERSSKLGICNLRTLSNDSTGPSLELFCLPYSTTVQHIRCCEDLTTQKVVQQLLPDALIPEHRAVQSRESIQSLLRPIPQAPRSSTLGLLDNRITSHQRWTSQTYCTIPCTCSSVSHAPHVAHELTTERSATRLPRTLS